MYVIRTINGGEHSRVHSKTTCVCGVRDIFREKMFDEFNRSLLSSSERSKWMTGSVCVY